MCVRIRGGSGRVTARVYPTPLKTHRQLAIEGRVDDVSLGLCIDLAEVHQALRKVGLKHDLSSRLTTTK